MPSQTSQSGTRAKTRAFRDDMLCPCTETTRSGFAAFLRANPALRFEEVLDQTGAGRTCTACMLDLEYNFAEAGRGEAVAKADSGPTGSAGHQGLKRSVYRAIDRLAPLVSSRTETWSPVLYSGAVSQHLWIANQHLLYNRDMEGPVPHSANVTVRDVAGNVHHSARYEVPVEDVLGIDLSQYLASAEGSCGLAAGSVQIVQRWSRPGLRGTTRSQIELAAPGAVCAVHTQAPGPAAEHLFTALYRPLEERLFYTVVNPESQPLTGRVTTRFGETDTDRTVEFSVPGFGTLLRELTPAADGADAAAESVLDLAWQLDGRHKLHLVCAAPALDRFSIDHL